MNLYDKIFFNKHKKPIRYEFHPTEDITAYELSLLLPLIVKRVDRSIEDMTEKYQKFPDNVKKHIKVIYE
jgi:hypothetical protein